MYYSSGNFEAFARPKKPEGIDNKKAWIVGGGLAGMAAAGFLVRDAQMPGSNITILEASNVDGGALDGAGNELTGWLLRGGFRDGWHGLVYAYVRANYVRQKTIMLWLLQNGRNVADPPRDQP